VRSDIGPAKKYANWDTVLVLEEMEAELDDNCDVSDCDNDENDPAPKKQRIVVSSNFSPSLCCCFCLCCHLLTRCLIFGIFQFRQYCFVYLLRF